MVPSARPVPTGSAAPPLVVAAASVRRQRIVGVSVTAVNIPYEAPTITSSLAAGDGSRANRANRASKTAETVKGETVRGGVAVHGVAVLRRGR
ncbi:MAG: hypothetical protein HY332_17240, partial [Chloroflexi bacterium]|nr:hypothetical protein [Chloroflexota bacterium]